MQSKMSKEVNYNESLSGKLSIASAEIENIQEAYRIAKVKIERLETQLKHEEQHLIRERSERQTQISDLQSNLIAEREVDIINQKRMLIQDKHQKYVIDAKSNELVLQTKLKKLELDTEMFQKDKVCLLDELRKASEKENSLNQLWEGIDRFILEKLQRIETKNLAKLSALQDLKDVELSDVKKRLENRVQAIEAEKTSLEQVF